MARKKGSETSEAFERAIEALTEAGADYALVGEFAAAFHGFARPTQDIEFIFLVPRIKLPELLEQFRRRGFDFSLEGVIRELGEVHLTSIGYGAARVVFLDAVIPIFRRTVEGAMDAEVQGQKARVARAQDLIALKMIAARPEDLRDVRSILAAQGEGIDLAAVRQSLLECCDEEQIEAFERLVKDAEL